MFVHLAICITTFLIAFTSYQSVQARSNTFNTNTVQPGDNLLSILRQNGFSESEREKVLKAHEGIRNFFLTLDTRYLVSKSRDGVELRMFDSQTSTAFQIIKKGSKITAQEFDPRYQIKAVRIEGRTSGSLMGSILQLVPSNWVASRFVDAYAFDLESNKKIPSGQRFGFTVEKLYHLGQFIKYGEVTDTSLIISGTNVRKKFVKHQDAGVFFNPQDLIEAKPLYAPVEYIKIASTFSTRRLHPITKKVAPHLGVDFELPAGDPVFAARKGVVARYGYNSAAGHFIVILHPNGMETSYNHLLKIDRRIHQGLQVKAGEKIGVVGCSGYCTRTHLHFAVKQKGRMIDPLKYLKSYPRHLEQHLQNKVAKN